MNISSLKLIIKFADTFNECPIYFTLTNITEMFWQSAVSYHGCQTVKENKTENTEISRGNSFIS